MTGGEAGSCFISQMGCLENVGATAAGRRDRQRQHPRGVTTSTASAIATATRRDRAGSRTKATTTVGARFGCGDASRDSTERFEGAVGTAFAIGDSINEEDGGDNFSDDRNRDRDSNDDCGDDGSRRTRTSWEGGRRGRRPEGTTSATATVPQGRPHREECRRFNVDETRTVFGTVREGKRGLARAALGGHFWGVEVSGALGLQKEGGSGGWAKRGQLPLVAVGEMFRAEPTRLHVDGE